MGLKAAWKALRAPEEREVFPSSTDYHDLFSFNVIPQMGRAVTGDAESYRYLVESIRQFPKPEAFAQMIRDAGFSRVKYDIMSGGIVALHSGWRL